MRYWKSVRQHPSVGWLFWCEVHHVVFQAGQYLGHHGVRSADASHLRRCAHILFNLPGHSAHFHPHPTLSHKHPHPLSLDLAVFSQAGEKSKLRAEMPKHFDATTTNWLLSEMAENRDKDKVRATILFVCLITAVRGVLVPCLEGA